MIHLTASNFEIEARDSDLPVVVMFYAVWCGKCAMMKPVVEQMEKVRRRYCSHLCYVQGTGNREHYAGGSGKKCV